MSDVTTGTISINVTDSQGIALEGALVSFLTDLVINRFVTDAAGNVEVTGLPVGDYTVNVSLGGYAGNTATVAIAAGETTMATIALTVNVTLGSVLALLIAQIKTIVDAVAPAAVSQIITKLESEEKTSTSLFVKDIRDPLEVALLNAIKSVVVSELDTKLTEVLQDILIKLEN